MKGVIEPKPGFLATCEKQNVFIFVGPATALSAYVARCQCHVPSTSISLDSSIASKMMKDPMQEKPEGVENEAVEQVHYALVRAAEPALADCECLLRWPVATSASLPACEVAFADRIILNKCDLVDEVQPHLTLLKFSL